jgi:subtilisin family serine protease
MNATYFDCDRGGTKWTLRIGLLCSVLAVYLQPAIASSLPRIDINAQVAIGTSSTFRYIVRDIQGLSGINLACSLLGCQVVESIGDPDGQLFLVQTSGLINSALFLTQLLSTSGVTNAEPDQTGNTHPAPVDTWPSYAEDKTPASYYGATVWEGYLVQTPNQIVRTSQTQSAFGVTGSGATVALIDTGIDPNNVILAPHLVYGYDFTRNTDGGSEMGDITQSTAGVVDGSPAALNQSTAAVVDQSTAGVVDGPQYSDFGHGTMTAGIVHLVAPNASLMPLKAFGANGTGYESDVLRAIYYAVSHQAKVISMSFEFASPSAELAISTTYATSNKVICVGSAGNDSSMTIVYPSGLPNVIDVASTSNTNTPSSFSNYGTPPVWISAPGEAVLTTYPYNKYALGWGTSFSVPFVSGTVALMASLAPANVDLLNQTTAAQALSHAQPIPQTQYGFGVLDTYQAVQAWQNFLDLNVSASCAVASCQVSVQ